MLKNEKTAFSIVALKLNCLLNKSKHILFYKTCYKRDEVIFLDSFYISCQNLLFVIFIIGKMKNSPDAYKLVHFKLQMICKLFARLWSIQFCSWTMSLVALQKNKQALWLHCSLLKFVMLHWIQLRADAGVCVRRWRECVSQVRIWMKILSTPQAQEQLCMRRCWCWLAHYQNADPLTLSRSRSRRVPRSVPLD